MAQSSGPHDQNSDWQPVGVNNDTCESSSRSHVPDKSYHKQIINEKSQETQPGLDLFSKVYSNLRHNTDYRGSKLLKNSGEVSPENLAGQAPHLRSGLSSEYTQTYSLDKNGPLTEYENEHSAVDESLSGTELNLNDCEHIQGEAKQLNAEITGYDLENYGSPAGSQKKSFGESVYNPGTEWGEIPQNQLYKHEEYSTSLGQNSSENYDNYNLLKTMTDRQDAYFNKVSAKNEKYEYRSNVARVLMVTSMLVSILVLGVSFLYGYMIHFSKDSDTFVTPVIEANLIPIKEQPKDREERKFEVTDSQSMNYVGKGVKPPYSYEEENFDANRVRKVSTLIVGRDGRLLEQGASAPKQVPSAAYSEVQQSSGIPGMIIEGGPGQLDSREVFQNDLEEAKVTSDQTRASVLATNSSLSTSTQPKQISITSIQKQERGLQNSSTNKFSFPPLPILLGQNKNADDLGPKTYTPGATVSSAFGPNRNIQTVVSKSVNDDLPENSSLRSVPKQLAASNGFVAVLSTKLSRIDALTSFADLQQLYPNILSSRVPDIRSADLTSRGLGIMYRTVAGPPGSQASANELCSKLKYVGYSNCWVASY
ncbi:MAG: hypothetical protein TECD_00561 [Hyphomicrobiaceae bacterium hypho_1]